MSRRSSRVLVVGLVLVVLGIGNWWLAATRMVIYGQEKQEALAEGGPGVVQPYRGTASILDPHSDAHDRFINAAIKWEYYQVAYRGGRFLVALGTLLVGGAIIRRLIVPDS